MTLQEVIEKSALDWGEREAIICESGSITYSQLNKWSNQIAQGLLSLGVQKGDKIAFMFPNSLAFAGAFFAIPKAGAVGVPLNIRLQHPEIRFILSHSEAKIVLFDSIYVETIKVVMEDLPSDTKFIVVGNDSKCDFLSLENLLESVSDTSLGIKPSPKDEAMFFYTSGTTGNPKGVVLTHENVLYYFDSWGPILGLKADDRLYISTPLFHCSASCILLASLQIGALSYFRLSFKAEEALKLIEGARITFAWAVPTMLILMQKHSRFHEFDLSSLRLLLSGGSPLSIETIKSWKNAWPNCKIYNGYAQTENATCGSVLTDEFILRKPNSIGKPNPGLEMKILDDIGQELPPGEIGEIAVRSRSTMKGYFKNPGLTKQTLRDGWCLSGDIGYTDDEGFFYYSGRKKDMIIRGGENIFPDEIEEVINQHSGVLESGAIGVPDTVMGEIVMGIVVLKPGVQLSEEEIINHCAEFLADYKVPKYIRFEPMLPKTSTEKINRRLLREKYA